MTSVKTETMEAEYPYPPSPPADADLSGLKQLAEISLATAAAGPAAGYSSLLTQLLYPNLTISPSSSPSPPPAHHTAPASPPPPGQGVPKVFLLPPQDSPLDLTTSASAASRIPEVEEEEADFPPYIDIRRDSVGTDSGESSGSEADAETAARRAAACFACPDCGKSYSSSSNLARHRQTHKPDQDMKCCPHCDKEYSSPAALNMHMRTHTAGCKCPFCGKSFSRPWLLQGHIRTHTGEKPFTCNLCNKAFADKSNLRAHVQTHSSDKPFSCSKCGKCFALKSYLSKHEESSCLKTERERSNSVSKRPRTSASPLTLPLASSLASPLASSLGSSSASSQLSLTRLLSSPSLLPHSHISAATLQALKMAVFANNKS